jgi:cyclohexyl-isocyanide hydratase
MSDFDVGFVIFPGITQLDFTGPFEVLSRLSTPPSVSVPSRFPQSRTHVIAKTLQLVSSDRGLSILPTCTFDNAPSLNLICVPGGAGVVDALADVETVDFMRRQGAHAQFVTSVCIGAFLLGAAGLLKGASGSRGETRRLRFGPSAGRRMGPLGEGAGSRLQTAVESSNIAG